MGGPHHLRRKTTGAVRARLCQGFNQPPTHMGFVQKGQLTKREVVFFFCRGPCTSMLASGKVTSQLLFPSGKPHAANIGAMGHHGPVAFLTRHLEVDQKVL